MSTEMYWKVCCSIIESGKTIQKKINRALIRDINDYSSIVILIFCCGFVTKRILY